jgi:hypothetical protein
MSSTFELCLRAGGERRAESPSAVETEDRIRLASGNRFALNLAQSSLAYFLLLLNRKVEESIPIHLFVDL